jgi:7-cyano-7-deazaguanine synthase
MTDQHVLILFSGGLDSTVCLASAVREFSEVTSITFDYGQQHSSSEIKQAKELCKVFGVGFNLFKISSLKQLADSVLVTKEKVEGDHKRKNLPAAYVPNRNATFLTIAHAFGQKIGADHLAFGVNKEDYEGFPDCRRTFLSIFCAALNVGSDSDIGFYAPLLDMNKVEIFLAAERLGILQLVLEKTHTCYQGIRNRFPWGYGCGKCLSCVTRKKAWAKFIYEKGRRKSE